MIHGINILHNTAAAIVMNAASNEPMDTHPPHYDIVSPNTDGDVIYECKDQTSFLVSSAVLRLSSGFSKTLLDSSFREGQVSRSPADPQRIELDEENSYALHRLLCLLHHQPDPDIAHHLANLAKNQPREKIVPAARRLQELAVTIDFYRCSERLNRVIGSRVFDCLLSDIATPNIRDRMTFTATIHVTSAAYILDNSRHFRLFTKRLVTEFTEPFEDAEFAEELHAAIALELSRRSGQAWYQLRINMKRLAHCVCTQITGTTFTSHLSGTDRMFAEKLTYFLLPQRITWPTGSEDGISLRHLLVGMYHLGSIHRAA
jgi:hypothetical protein